MPCWLIILVGNTDLQNIKLGIELDNLGHTAKVFGKIMLMILLSVLLARPIKWVTSIDFDMSR